MRLMESSADSRFRQLPTRSPLTQVFCTVPVPSYGPIDGGGGQTEPTISIGEMVPGDRHHLRAEVLDP